jgi:hypothetical protein
MAKCWEHEHYRHSQTCIKQGVTHTVYRASTACLQISLFEKKAVKGSVVTTLTLIAWTRKENISK